MKSFISTCFFVLSAQNCCWEVLAVDSRWEELPPVQNNLFIGDNETFKWTFKDQSRDKASVSVIHAPQNLHYEFSVASGEIHLNGPETELNIYHQYMGRVKIIYHAETVTMYIWNCTADDTGELFIQINFEGDVPLTYSIFFNIYQEPKWRHTPDSNLFGFRGEDLIIPLELENVELVPLITKVVAYFVPNMFHAQDKNPNATMIITPPNVRGVLQIGCEPFHFHKHFRYTGEADLYQLEFTITDLDEDKTGNYTIEVFFEFVNFHMNHEMTVNLSEKKPPTVHTTKPRQTSVTELSGELWTHSQTPRDRRIYFRLTVVLALVVVVLVVMLSVLATIWHRRIPKNKPTTSPNQSNETSVCAQSGDHKRPANNHNNSMMNHDTGRTTIEREYGKDKSSGIYEDNINKIPKIHHAKSDDGYTSKSESESDMSERTIDNRVYDEIMSLLAPLSVIDGEPRHSRTNWEAS